MKTLYRILVYTLGLFSVHSFGQQTLTASNASNEGGAIQLLNPLKTANNTASNWTFYNMTGPYGNSLQFWNYGNGGFYGSRFTILDNGNVGVGTTAPISKLSVFGSISLVSGLTNTSSRPAITENTLANGEIRAYNGANNRMDDGFIRISAGGGTTGSVKSYMELSGYSTIPDMDRNIVIGTSGNERIRIDKNGYVGIGTTNPTSKLTVAGNINSREVKVTVDAGADFVFAEDYALPSLDSVDRYIKENKHLPEIAAADEMKKDGINLSEMNIKLLQKVEELTLYMIEQNKKMDLQQKENALQSKQIEEQHIRIMSLQKKMNNIK